MNNDKMHTFLSNLKDDDNKLLVEAILDGYNAIFEGYADVADFDRTDAVTRFSRSTAYDSLMGGMPTLNFLNNSSEILNNQYYSKYPDVDPELDVYTTTSYLTDEDMRITDPMADADDSQYMQQNTTDGFEDSFGFSSSDLENLV